MKAEARARPVKNGQAFKALLCSTKGAKVFLFPSHDGANDTETEMGARNEG